MKPLKKTRPGKTLKSKRITVRRYELRFSKTMFDCVVQDRERLARFLPWPKFMKSVEDERDHVRTSLKEWEKFEKFAFCMFRNEDGAYMGNIDVHAIRWDLHRCEIGYWIASEFEGNGYVAEAVRALEKDLFRIGFNRIEIRCNTENIRSARIPQTCGYTHEGTLRQDGLDMGKFKDTMVFGKLKSERRK